MAFGVKKKRTENSRFSKKYLYICQLSVVFARFAETVQNDIFIKRVPN